MAQVIDVHNHVVPPSAVRALGEARNPFRATVRERVVEHHDGMAFPLAAEMDDVEAKLASLDRSRIDAAVVSPSPTLLGCNHPADEALEPAGC